MNAPASAPVRRSLAGLLRYSACWHLTGLGWLALLLLFLILGAVGVLRLYPFLAPNEPRPEGPVVVEGWGGTLLMRAALAEYQKHPVPPLLVSGGPIEDDSPLAEQFPTFAELGAWQLRRLGAKEPMIQAIPAPPVQKDRTFASADMVRDWFQRQGALPKEITVISAGPHSRRTRLLYQQAFGKATRIGIVAVPEPNYDPARWWQYSAGFRGVIDESIAYLYASLLFWRPAE